MPTLLLEIGCEELPASACREAQEQLPALCRQHLGVAPSGLFVGPRRLALLVDELPEREPDEWRRGPAERVAYDGAGMPTRWLEATLSSADSGSCLATVSAMVLVSRFTRRLD